MFTKNSNILERYQHKLYFMNLRKMYEFSTSTSFKTNSPKQVPPNAVVKTTEVQEIHMAAFLQQKYCSCSPIKLNIDLWTYGLIHFVIVRRLNLRLMLLFLGGTFGNIGFGMPDHLTCHSQLAITGCLLLSDGFQIKSSRKIFWSLKLK